MKKLLSTVIVAMGLGALVGGVSAPALAEGKGGPIQHLDWEFDGPFGHFDTEQLQRGYVVFRQLCASCHSMSRVKFRHLAQIHRDPANPASAVIQQGIGLDLAFIENEAAQIVVDDVDPISGQTFTRQGSLEDTFPWPFDNKQTAAAAFGKAPPDFSRLALALADKGGADYIYSLLLGYDAEKSAELTAAAQAQNPDAGDVHYNPVFGGQIAMPPPIREDGQVSYPEGVKEEYMTMESMAADVTAFMVWGADPTMIQRKQLGVIVILFMLVLTGVSWLAYRRIAVKVNKQLQEEGGGPWDRDDH